MNNDNRSILKLFTRKLANCRYRVTSTSLVDFLRSGKFGFVRTEDQENVVTNEYLFVDDISTVIPHLRAIFKDPRISLKQEEAILNASAASYFDQRSLEKNIKDEKLWKIKDGQIQPEYVHSYVQEDNLAIYENRFLSSLIDLLFKACTVKLQEIVDKLKTLNGEIGGYDLETEIKSFNRSQYVNFVTQKGGIPALTTSKDGTVTVINALAKVRKQLLILKESPVYRACAKLKEFSVESVQPTNLLIHDAHYNFCYNFYVKYFKKDIDFCSESEMYFNFVIVNTLLAIDNLGFKPMEENENISISNNIKLKFNELTFEKSPFILKLSPADNALSVKVINEINQNTAKYLFKVIYSNDAPKPFIPEDVAYKIMTEKTAGITASYLITDVGSDGSDNITKVVANQRDAEVALDNLLKSILILVEGSEYVHSRYCPVCGGSMVTSDNNDYYCDVCNSVYHLFDYNNKTLIWIKRLPTPAKESVFEKLSNSKSFKDKIAQSEGSEKEYYEELRKHILSYKKTRSKISFSYDNVFIGRDSKVKFAVRGKTLVMFTALDFSEYENSKYRPKYKGDSKKYKDTPTMVKIKSERGVKFAKELIDIICEGLPLRSPEELAKIFEVALTIDEPKTPFMSGNYLSKSFNAKLRQSEQEVKDFYLDVRNYLLSFKKVRSSISWNYDSIFLGRKNIAKLAVRGKTLVLFTALDFGEYENTKYHPKNMGDTKKYEDTPTMVKIKSERGVKFAKELIDKLLEGVNKIDNYTPEKVDLKYLSDKKLIELKLAKEVFVK